MSSVLLDTILATTDSFAGLSADKVAHYHATVKFTNPSSTAAVFRVVSVHDGKSVVQKMTVTVGANEQGEITVFPLSPGSSTKLYLERLEVDQWIRQTSTSSLDYVLVTTPTTSLSITSGSTSAKLTFPAPVPDAEYMIGIREKGANNSHRLVDHVVNGSSGEGKVSGLKKGTEYVAHLVLKLPQHILDYFNPVDHAIDIHMVEFTTSHTAEMVLTGPFASYMEIDWAASVDGKGSEYRVVNRVGGSDDVLVESSTETNATIRDLQPGSEYQIVLQRLEIGTWADQNKVLATTLTSELSLSSTASRTMELTWSPMYAGALFEILYSAGSGSAGGSGQTQEHSAVLRNLQPETEYEVKLVVYELGEPVGLVSLGMTTNPGMKSKVKLGIVALILILVAFLIMK